MHSRLRIAATVIAGATILAVAANGISYASSGHGLIAGSHKAASKTTVIKKSGPGPALSLISKGNTRPSLAVSSTAQVKNLNASRVGGHTADSLSSNAITFRAGQRGDFLSDPQFFSFSVKRGVYDVSLQGVFLSESEEPGVIQCFVIDPSMTHVLVGATTPIDDSGTAPIPSGANVTKAPGGRLFLQCSATQEVTYFQPLQVSFTKINKQTVKHAIPVPQEMVDKESLLGR